MAVGCAALNLMVDEYMVMNCLSRLLRRTIVGELGKESFEFGAAVFGK